MPNCHSWKNINPHRILKKTNVKGEGGIIITNFALK